MTSQQEVNNLEPGGRRGGASANLSGYTILPKYRKSQKPSYAIGQPHHHNNNNNNIKYHQLPTGNKSTANKRHLPPKTTVLPATGDHVFHQPLSSPTGHKPVPTSVAGSKNNNSNSSFHGGDHYGEVPRSDGVMRRKKMMKMMEQERPDVENMRRDHLQRTKNPNDVSFFLGDEENASAMSSQARNPRWTPWQTSEIPPHSTTLKMSQKSDDLAGPSLSPRQQTSHLTSNDDNVILIQPTSSSSTPSSSSSPNIQQLQGPTNSIKTEIKAKVDLRGKVKVEKEDDDEEEDDDGDDDDDYEVRPSGVVIKKKYKTGLILGKYKNDSKNSILNFPGRKLRRQLTATNNINASPKRRRDIFRSSSPDLHRLYSDSTTGLVPPKRSQTSADDRLGAGGCLASPRVNSSATVDSSNDYMSLPLLDPQSVVNAATKNAGSAGEMNEKSKCETRRQKCLSFLKSFMEFLFSTIGLFCCLVGYVCVGGLIFQQLESPNERRINREMKELRESKVRDLWSVTAQMNVLHPDNWTKIAEEILENYTLHVFNSVKKQGWDGKEDNEENQDLQWSFAGSLLYSITVITTIGYGHIAPKTDWGRIVTMLYAIIGIPLTLLTITNLGGFMATAFRFLYRNICCRLICVCCRNKARLQHSRKSANRQLVLMGKTVTATIIPPEKCKRDASNPWWEGNVNTSYQSPSTTSFLPTKPASSSNGSNKEDLSPIDLVCSQPHPSGHVRKEDDGRMSKEKTFFWKRQKLKRSWTECEKDKQKDRQKPPVTYSQSFDGEKLKESSALMQNSKQPRAKKRRKQEEQFDIEVSEPRRLPWRKRFEDIFNTDDIKQVKVPILVSLMLITGYIGLGALLFSFWEKDWSYLIGCYFCFVTLSTIGFGDYVPGTSADEWNNQAKLVLCAMYLFVGLALIAMCFDLMLEQVRCKFRKIGRCLGILDDGGKRKKLKMRKEKKKKVVDE